MFFLKPNPPVGGTEEITASRNLTLSDHDKILENTGATDIVLIWPSGLPSSGFIVAGKRSSTGNIQIVAGSGVSQIGNANITALQGQYVVASANGTPDSFDVKAG
jgi:hypothetical protein